MLEKLHAYIHTTVNFFTTLWQKLLKDPWPFWLGLAVALVWRAVGYEVPLLSLAIFAGFFYLFRLAFAFSGFGLSFLPLPGPTPASPILATPYAVVVMYVSMAYVIITADYLQVNPWHAYILAAVFLTSFALTQFILDGSPPGLPDRQLYNSVTAVRHRTIGRRSAAAKQVHRTVPWALLVGIRYALFGVIFPVLWLFWSWRDQSLWQREDGWLFFLLQMTFPLLLWALFLIAHRFLLLGPYQRTPPQQDVDRLNRARKGSARVEWFTWMVIAYTLILCLLFVFSCGHRSACSPRSLAYLLYPFGAVVILLYGLHVLHQHLQLLYEGSGVPSSTNLRVTARFFCFLLVPLFAAWIVTSLVDTWQRWWGPSQVISRSADGGGRGAGTAQCQEVWLALSGGGYRAAAIHLGVLQGLEALQRPPDLISSVSGGSIVGAFYAAGGKTEQFERILGSGNNFVSQLIARQRDIPKLGLWDYLFHVYNVVKMGLPGISRTDVYAEFFDETYFHGLKLADVQSAHLLVNTTDLDQQKRVVFYGVKGTDPNPADASSGVLYGGPNVNSFVDLAHAVAASGAFPGAFRPLTLKESVFQIRAPQLGRGAENTDGNFLQERRFIDGGAIENLGLDGLNIAWRDKQVGPIIGCPGILVISDASQKSKYLGSGEPSLSHIVLAANDVTWQANHERLLEGLIGPGHLARYAFDTPLVQEAPTSCLRGAEKGKAKVIVLDPTSSKGRRLLENAARGNDSEGNPLKPETAKLCQDLKMQFESYRFRNLLDQVADIPTLKDLDPDEARIAIAVGKCSVGLFAEELLKPLAKCTVDSPCPPPPVCPSCPECKPCPPETSGPSTPPYPNPDAGKKITIILRGGNFDFDKDEIKRDFKLVLDEGARLLHDNPSVTVSIEGHTDSKGTDAYNQRLSERRAKAVRQYLMSRGVEPSRLSTIGKGETAPIAENMKDGKDNPEGRAMNRRVELIVTQPEATSSSEKTSVGQPDNYQ
jgi:outer membrane protein OmpA-like peptidoglycan-associated protein/predicted acylesterase/phospholipase RssA